MVAGEIYRRPSNAASNNNKKSRAADSAPFYRNRTSTSIPSPAVEHTEYEAAGEDIQQGCRPEAEGEEKEQGCQDQGLIGEAERMTRG